MIKLWTDGEEAGFLDRSRESGSAFVYRPGAPPERAVSVTMPVRLESWDTSFGLAPIFEMNLPEGALRERLRLAFAKATGRFDDFSLLSVVGRSQLGRIRYTGAEDRLDEQVPFQSVDEILANRRGGTLYPYLIEKFASASGISGVQPKVLVRDNDAFAVANAMTGQISNLGVRLSESYRGATHIVKFWNPEEFPQLAANEFFCLEAARRCGLDMPTYRLAEDGLALVLDRFDLRADGTYQGFEDFCVLNARRTDQKYRGSYETAIMKRFQQYANSPHVFEDLKKLFTLIALNCALRNGDAHLKNFAILYDDVRGEARLAPVYDLITTTVYLPQDGMALTLDGSTLWPSAKKLHEFGVARTSASASQVGQILERIADAMTQTARQLRAYSADHPRFAPIGKRMIEEWEAGVRHSLLG